MKTASAWQWALLPLAPCAAAAAPTATLDAGPVVGVATDLPGAGGPVNKFLGIPYAAPPQRFGLARRPEPWTAPRNASAFGPSCPQLSVDAAGAGSIIERLFNTHPPESEDCLYMNAFAPAAPGPAAGRPVLVFIHGGAFQLGNGLLDLSGFAGYEDVVAFAFNYRTNIFGFPSGDDVPVTHRNLGLRDQQLALSWVQANAWAFGGDAARVTLWGESAGAMSVDAHMQRYATGRPPPPFAAGILSSGQMSHGLLAAMAAGGARATHTWDAVARLVGCRRRAARLACLRAVPARRLLDAMAAAKAMFLPVVDNTTVFAGRAAAWREGRVVAAPLLMTTTAQEGRVLVGANLTLDETLATTLPEAFVTRAERDAIVARYRAKPGLVSDFDVAAAIYTDFVMQCPQQLLAAAAAAAHRPVWRGYFNASITELLPAELGFLGKFHGSDVLLLFAFPSVDGGPKLTPQLYAFAHYFRGVIGRFARTPGAGPGWPAVGSAYAPFDVATLGDVGGERSAGATPVDRRLLDADCAVYADALRRIERLLG